MPARTNGSATKVAKAKRFELPALDFKFASLTEGTDIPPPLPSPVAEAPPARKREDTTPSDTTSSKTNGAQPGANGAPSAPSNAPSAPPPAPLRAPVRAGLKRAADDVPVSPTLLARPGSIRRLFSRSLLNTAYANAEGNKGQLPSAGSAATAGGGSILRPDSRSDGSTLDERRARRSSGWFRRLRGGAGDHPASADGSILDGSSGPRSPLAKRSSILFADAKKPPQPPAKPAGPPPPMIPELAELEAKVNLDDGSLSGDLFKNIN